MYTLPQLHIQYTYSHSYIHPHTYSNINMHTNKYTLPRILSNTYTHTRHLLVTSVHRAKNCTKHKVTFKNNYLHNLHENVGMCCEQRIYNLTFPICDSELQYRVSRPSIFCYYSLPFTVSVWIYCIHHTPYSKGYRHRTRHHNLYLLHHLHAFNCFVLG